MTQGHKLKKKTSKCAVFFSFSFLFALLEMTEQGAATSTEEKTILVQRNGTDPPNNPTWPLLFPHGTVHTHSRFLSSLVSNNTLIASVPIDFFTDTAAILN